jgi:hypothetical protein
MQLETGARGWGGVLVSSYCCSSYRVADPFSSLGTFSPSFIRGPVFHPIDDCEHPLLYLPGTGIASQERAMTSTVLFPHSTLPLSPPLCQIHGIFFIVVTHTYTQTHTHTYSHIHTYVHVKIKDIVKIKLVFELKYII